LDLREKARYKHSLKHNDDRCNSFAASKAVGEVWKIRSCIMKITWYVNQLVAELRKKDDASFILALRVRFTVRQKKKCRLLKMRQFKIRNVALRGS
jgi:hypothetical protein